jgi:hypothetical protein
MKNLIFTLFSLLFTFSVFSQTVENANVYPSNLEENMYYSKYDDATKKITGLYFLLLADGNNSQHVTPAFKVKIYLLPEGKTSKEDLIIIKTYEIKGLYHMGSMEFKDQTIDLSKIPGLKTGKYRLGIWVNSEESFEEDKNDNATLFKGTISFTAGASSGNDNIEEEKKTDDGWGSWD